jgi:hypothetical protein
MPKVDLSNYFAAEMDKTLNSADHQKMFSTSAMLEKLAFNRVSEEGKLPSEVENELLTVANKESCCECAKGENKHGCKCACHEKTTKNDVNDAADAGSVLEEVKENTVKAASVKTASTNDIVNTLLQVSTSLEDNGFEKLASFTLKLADRLIVEAKAKKMSKSEKDAADKKKKKSEKAKADKAKAEKAKASAKAKSSKKSAPKSSKKSSKKSDMYVARMKLGQATPMPDASDAPQHLAPDANSHGKEYDAIMAVLAPSVKGTIQTLEVPAGSSVVNVKFKPGMGSQPVFDAIVAGVQKALPQKAYKVHPVQ